MDITTLIVGIILGLYAIVTGTLEFLDRLGFPTPLQKQRDAKNKKIILNTLEETGLLASKGEIQQLGDLINFRKKVPIAHSRQMLGSTIKKYVEAANNVSVGLYEKTELAYYINLVSAMACPEDGRIITRIMCRQIIDEMTKFAGEPFQFDKIAISKVGNTALGLCVALELQKPWVFVDVRGGTIRSETVEGDIQPEDRVIIIHDVLASGKLMEVCAQELSKKQAIVKHVFVLIERTDRENSNEALPSTLLNECGLSLHALTHLNDNDLAEMYKSKN
jgi:orotate phosphoribosyltransferase